VIGFFVVRRCATTNGGGKFFINLAFALLGHVGVAAAKVAVFSSGLNGVYERQRELPTCSHRCACLFPVAERWFFWAVLTAARCRSLCRLTGGVLMPL